LENESVTAYRMTAIIPALALAVTRLMFGNADSANDLFILIWPDGRVSHNDLFNFLTLNSERLISNVMSHVCPYVVAIKRDCQKNGLLVNFWPSQ
jgi:hypothetical protein